LPSGRHRAKATTVMPVALRRSQMGTKNLRKTRANQVPYRGGDCTRIDEIKIIEIPVLKQFLRQHGMVLAS